MMFFPVLGKPQDVDLMVCTDLIDQVGGRLHSRGPEVNTMDVEMEAVWKKG